MPVVNTFAGLTLVAEASNVATYISRTFAMGRDTIAMIGTNVQTMFKTGGTTATLSVFLDPSTDGRNFDVAASAAITFTGAEYKEAEATSKSGYFRVRVTLDLSGGSAGDLAIATFDTMVNLSTI